MKKKKLTKITAIVIGLLIGIPLIVFGFLMSQGVFTRASGSAPDTVNIVRITSTSATVTWSTGQDTQGVIQYGTAPSQLNLVAPERTKTSVHRVELTLLKPSTTYYFVIKVGDTVFDNAGVPWSFTTKASEKSQSGTDSASLGEETTGDDNEDSLDDIEIEIDFEDDDSLVYIISPTLRASTPTPSPGITVVPTLRSSTPTPLPGSGSGGGVDQGGSTLNCPVTNNCQTIRDNFGKGCTSADYIKCLKDNITPTNTPAPTPTPPDAPSDLSATVSGTLVTLTWTDQSVGETEYRIYRSDDGSTGFSRVATKIISNDTGSGSPVSHQLNSQPSGTKYYKVYSYIEETRSNDSSNVASVTIP
ncbi:MAG: fibronectin type III domain-containing protein [Patescibacteria group bacterium]